MSLSARLGHAGSPRESSTSLNSSPISAGEMQLLHRGRRAQVGKRFGCPFRSEQVEDAAA